MPALIKLSEIANSKSDSTDPTFQKLSLLASLAVDVPKTLCLTVAGLKAIAEANNLRAKIYKLIQETRFADPVAQTRFKKNLQNIFYKIEIPREISHQLQQTYHDYFDGELVRIFGPQMVSSSPLFSNIAGEANLMESLLLFWHSLVEDRLKYSNNSQVIPQIIYQSPIFIQAHVRTLSSGKAFSVDPETGDKKIIIIKSHWGSGTENKDEFKVDSRTHIVVSKEVGTQEKQAIRKTDHFHHDNHQTVEVVAKEEQSQPSISGEVASEISQLTQKIKQRHLNQIELNWEYNGNNVVVIGFNELNYSPSTHHKSTKVQTQTHNTATKLFVSASNPSLAKEIITNHVDGLGILKSEFTFASFGMHPMQLIRSNKSQVLIDQLVQTISSFQLVLKGRPLIYRALNFTSGELRSLKYAENFEPDEPNPYLGLRGALKSQINPSIFELELEAIEQNIDQNQAPIKLLLPFVRSSSELHFLIALIEKSGLLSNSNFEVWMQLNTPENILNLTAYPLKHIAGLTFNTKSIHALLHGIDPDNPEIINNYPLNTDQIIKLLKQVAQTIKHSLQSDSVHHQKDLFLHMDDYNSELTRLAIELGVAGIIVKPKAVGSAKSCIIETEKLLMGK